jgi:hypothetical protein
MTPSLNTSLKCIQFLLNHNTRECSLSFGLPFSFDGPLFGLPPIKDGKPVHVLGLTPYTVELVIPIPYDRSQDAINACNWYANDTAAMIKHIELITSIN